MDTKHKNLNSSKNVDDLMIDGKTTILGAIQQMDRVGRKLLIVSDGGLFKSLVSIGDVQRAILSTGSLNVPIQEILRENVRVAHSNDAIEDVHDVMLKHRTEFMPVIDTGNNIVEVLFWEDVFGQDRHTSNKLRGIPVVIMAGGEGRRLKPITNIIPKPLVPLGERPILQHIMDRFHRFGVDTFFVSVNYKADMIERYFREVAPPYHLKFFKESKPLGTAGSLSLLKNDIDRTFFVSNCDILIEEDLASILEYHHENGNKLTAVGAIKHYDIPYGTMDVGKDGLLKSMKEKPNINFFVNAGLYVLEPDLIDLVPDHQFFHITELIDLLLQKNERVGVFPVSEASWMDIGVWREYDKTSDRWT